MKWYVVQAYSGYENKVKLSLEERIKQAGMEASFGNILIPKENVQESRGGKPRLSTRTFYPGYIFVQMDLSDETWHLIKDTPKVFKVCSTACSQFATSMGRVSWCSAVTRSNGRNTTSTSVGSVG